MAQSEEDKRFCQELCESLQGVPLPKSLAAYVMRMLQEHGMRFTGCYKHEGGPVEWLEGEPVMAPGFYWWFGTPDEGPPTNRELLNGPLASLEQVQAAVEQIARSEADA